MCPRCHRSIPAGELAEHIRQHKGKVPHHLRTRKKIKRKTHLEPSSQQLPSFNELFKQRMLKKPIKSNLSEKEIRSKFEKSLADVATTYNSLKLEPTQNPQTIEVTIGNQRNLSLQYNSHFLKTLTEDDINAILLHEACHVATLPNSQLSVPDTGNIDQTRFMVDYLESYDEYLAHVFLMSKFKQDKRFEGVKSLQIDLFKDIETMINSNRTLYYAGDRKGLQINPFMILRSLHSIAYDALFFYITKDDSFLKWCNENNLEALYIFINWIFEDFEHLRNLGLTLKKTHDKLITSGVLSWSVNPIKLIVMNQIEFAETSKSLHEEMMQKGQDIDLVAIWENRRKMYQK